MTVTAPDDRAAVDLPDEGTGARLQRRRQRRHARAAIVVVMVLLMLAVPVLGYVGYHTVFNTTAGRKVDPENDPSKPNYEANVTPTPVALIVHTDATNALLDLDVLVLGNGDRGGTVIMFPGTTVTDANASTPVTFASAWAKGGLDAVQQPLANLLRLSFDEVDVVAPDRFAALVAPAAPLTIDNPDRISSKFPTGAVTLSADDAVAYLAATTSRESDLNRLARSQLVWNAWLRAIATSNNPNVIPGETTRGLGRYLRGLADGTTNVVTAPVDASGSGFTADAPKLDELISSTVPLPTSAAPGDRVRVRILDGAHAQGVWSTAAAKVVPAGAEVVIVGSADRFSYDTTQVVYYSDDFAAAANSLQQALGVGQTVRSTAPFDAADVTIVIGRDFVNKFGTATTVSGG